MNSKPLILACVIAATVAFASLAAIPGDGADTTADSWADVGSSTLDEIDQSIPYFIITLTDGTTQYYQATTVNVSETSTDGSNTYNENFYCIDSITKTSYSSDSKVTILENDAWDEATLEIVIPAGTEAYAYGYETSNTHVDFPSNLASITITGGGTLNHNIPNISKDANGAIQDYTGNGAIGFNGVETDIDGIKLGRMTVYAGSSYQESSLDSTDLVVDATDFEGSIIYGGSRYGDVGTTNLTIDSLSGSGTKYIYGGNNTKGSVGTTNVTLNGCTCSNIYVAGGGAGESSCGVANITANGGSYSFIFGGGNGASSRTETANITFNDGATSTSHIYGGGMGGSYTGSVDIEFNGGTAKTSVYAGGFNSNVGTSHVAIHGGDIGRGVLAGGRGGNNTELGCVESAEIEVTGGSIGMSGTKDRGIFAGGGTDDETTGPVGSVRITVTGGNIFDITDSDANTQGDAVVCENSSYAIRGGTFAEDVSGFLDDGYQIVDGEVVGPEPSVPGDSGFDDDELPPFIPTQPKDSGDDVTIIACAAAAVVAALMAVFLIISYKKE